MTPIMELVFVVHRANVHRDADAEPRTINADDCIESAMVTPSW
jgi:hypothetical protein